MKRRILALVMCVVMAIGLIGTASAKLIQSAERSYYLNNRTYKGWAELEVSRAGFLARACVREASGSQLDAGSLRARAELYDSSGRRLDEGILYANYNGAGYVLAETRTIPSSLAAYGKGYIEIYIEENHQYGRFLVGPTAQEMPMMEEMAPFAVNSHGKTYGTALYATEMSEIPDLIAAVGLYGTEGYIKKEDAYPTLGTPEEVLARIQEEQKTTWIPLYDAEENQIGLYEFAGSASACDSDPEYQAKLTELSEKWSVNSLGMTYGNDFDTVYTGGNIYRPTLIAAVGRDKDGNRVEGYILSERESVDTLEDTLNWGKTMEELPIPFFIAPLYNSEFEQIGGFRIGGTLPDKGAEQEAFWATYFASLEG